MPPRAPQLERVHGDVEGPRRSAWESVYRIVRRIPRGRVMTYGQIAFLLGSRLSARAVGWALHQCPDDLPWQRVVNASGGCSTDRFLPPGLQRAKLEAEGVRFGPAGTLPLEKYRFTPRRKVRRRALRARAGGANRGEVRRSRKRA